MIYFNYRLPIRCLQGVALTLLFSLEGITASQAAEVIGGPTGQQFSVDNLRDGNYRFCSSQPPEDVNRVSGTCFRFRKQNNVIIGDYYYPYEGSSICLNGRVNGNTVTGQAVERLSVNESPPDSLPGTQLTDWRQEGFLQVGRGFVIDLRNRRRDAIHYRSAMLDLNDFYQYNAGTVLPPSECWNRFSGPVGANPDPNDLRQVGTSVYFNQPVYLDASSINPLDNNRYTFTTVVGTPDRLSETEYRLDCNNPATIQVLRSRYYDGDGDLQEVEVVNQVVPATRDNQSSIQRYNASQYICNNTTEPVVQVPDDISYQRYQNDRFNYSVLYPDNLVTPQGEPTNQDGQVFRDASGEIMMRVHGQNNSQGETLTQYYQEAQSGRSVTYNTLGDDFFVVSGYQGGTIFYQKTILNDNVLKVLEIEYARSLQPELGSVVSAIANSFSSTMTNDGSAQLPADVQNAVFRAAAIETGQDATLFEVISAEQQTWPNGCLGLASPDEFCTQVLVPGWQVQIVIGTQRLTYRTNETGSQIRRVPTIS